MVAGECGNYPGGELGAGGGAAVYQCAGKPRIGGYVGKGASSRHHVAVAGDGAQLPEHLHSVGHGLAGWLVRQGKSLSAGGAPAGEDEGGARQVRDVDFRRYVRGGGPVCLL